MRKKPLIGIVARPNTAKNNKMILSVYQNYVKKINKNNGIPILILNPQNIDYEVDQEKCLTSTEEQELLLVLKLCDGILMPGGDEGFMYDYFITKYALDHNVPLLGICLGMQLIGECLGGKLIDVPNHYLKEHKVILKRDSLLNKIYQSNTILVNSRHQSQIVDVCPNYISATSEDGVIEGIEDKTKLFCIGVEWHPEDLDAEQLFQEFIKKSSQYRG